MADRQEPGITALVVGATGLVGDQVVRTLLESEAYERIAILTRRPFPDPSVRSRIEQRFVRFDHLEGQADAVRGDHVFCALGTTMRKAGDRERFRQVDLEYTGRVADLSRTNGARHFTLVSAACASARSLFFYSRAKAAAEKAVIAARFPGTSILRPSVLGGERTERRPGERFAQWALRFAPARWRTIEARDVARAMVRLALEEAPGVRIVESRDIAAIARRTGPIA